MRRRTVIEHEPLPSIDYRGLTKGRDVKVKGERGKFRFMSARLNPQGQIEVTCYGGSAGREHTRVFTAERIIVKRKRGDEGGVRPVACGLASVAAIAVAIVGLAFGLVAMSPAPPYTGPAIMVGHPGYNVPHQSPPYRAAHVVGDPGAWAPFEARP